MMVKDHRPGNQGPQMPEQKEREAREARIYQLLRDDDELLGKAYDDKLVRRLGGYLTPYKRSLIFAVVLMTISSLLGVSGPAIIGIAIDNGIRAGSMEVLRFWTIVFLVSIIGEWLTNRARVRIMAYVGTRIVADMRSERFDRYTELYEADDPSEHYGTRTGFPPLDNLLTAMAPGHLIVLAGRPSMERPRLRSTSPAMSDWSRERPSPSFRWR